MTSDMVTSTFSTGWCYTCDTNACEHVKHLNACNRQAFDMLLKSFEQMKPETKLPGLTGEPWRKYPHG